VELTNNRSERALRTLLLHSKIIGTLRNGKGVRMYEGIPSLLATWEQRGLNPPRSLSEALTQIWKESCIQKQTTAS